MTTAITASRSAARRAAQTAASAVLVFGGVNKGGYVIRARGAA
jgi:hypothetical protein